MLKDKAVTAPVREKTNTGIFFQSKEIGSRATSYFHKILGSCEIPLPSPGVPGLPPIFDLREVPQGREVKDSGKGTPGRPMDLPPPSKCQTDKSGGSSVGAQRAGATPAGRLSFRPGVGWGWEVCAGFKLTSLQPLGNLYLYSFQSN